MGLALTVALGGAVLAFSPQWPGVLTDARFYALVVALVGLGNAVAGAISSRGQAAL